MRKVINLPGILGLVGACLAGFACGSSDNGNDAGSGLDATPLADASVRPDAAPLPDAHTNLDATAGDAAAGDAAAGLDAQGGLDATTTSTPSCAAYCTTIMQNCTGANQQFTNIMNCRQSCKTYPVGALADRSGDTLGCRVYHAGAAAADPNTHCPHAGPSGDGVCGAVCDGYCQLAETYCVPPFIQTAIYTDHNDCETTCGMFRSDMRFNISIQSGMEKACLVYHAQEASSNPPDHCNGDLAKTATLASTTCHD
jgi:hypothetical protein